MNLGSLLRAVWRLRWSIVIVFLVLVSVCLLLVYSTSPTWSSNSVIVIKRPDGAVSEVRQNTQELLYERVEILKASILSPDNLDRLIAELASESVDTISDYEELQEGISIEIDNISVVNRYTGKLGLQPLSISVNYDGNTAIEAFSVANKLTNQVLDESRLRDKDSGKYRENFLDEEVAKASDRLISIEAEIAKFKTDNSLLLPEFKELYLRQLEENRSAIDRSLDLIGGLELRASQVDSELASTNREALLVADDGTRIESTAERIDGLRVELASASSRYSAEHPEVKSLTRDIAALTTVTSGYNTAQLELELKSVVESLSSARETYTESHPTVQRLSSQYDKLVEQLRIIEAAGNAPAVTSAPSSPAYNRLIVTKRAIEANIIREGVRIDELQREANVLNGRFALMPTVESQFLGLSRELTVARETYEDREDARSTTLLESGLREKDLLGSLSLVVPPAIPESPSAPNRVFLSILAVLLSIFVALSIAIWRSIFGDRIYEFDRYGSEPGECPVHLVPKF